MQEIGEILEIKENKVVVEIARHSACEKCTQHCALATDKELAKFIVEVDNKLPAKIGQLVKIEMAEKPLIIATIIIYLLPLISLILGYYSFTYIIVETELAGIIGSVIFFIISFFLIKFLDKRILAKEKLKPHIKEIIPRRRS